MSEPRPSMPKEIAEAISAVMNEVGYVEKKGENTFHNYKYAAVGDVLTKVQPAMVNAGLIITQTEVSNKLDKDLGAIVIEYDFILSHKSGITWEFCPRHTGMAAAFNSKNTCDDKAMNKCHTAARKYFILGLFEIPTGTEVDPDAGVGDRPRAKSESRPIQRKAKIDIWLDEQLTIIAAMSESVEIDKYTEANSDGLAALARKNPPIRQQLGEALAARFQELSAP